MKRIRRFIALALWVIAASASMAQEAEIWVNFADSPNRSSNGIYGFPATDPTAITAKKTEASLYLTQGVAYQDGIIYGLYYQQGWFSADRYILYQIDTKDWSYTTRDVNSTFALKESANGVDGTVYALFSDGYIGTIDYKTNTRTNIYEPSRSYKALGVTSYGDLYGIDGNGQLVSINTANGSETVVGSTGIDFYSYGTATGEIDPVTNTFYLLAETNYSDPAMLYAIDLATAQATSVGRVLASYDYLTDMIILGEPAENGAPGKATGLQAQFVGNALEGTVSFVAPTETFDHKPLTGELSYALTYGSATETTLRGTAEAGAAVSHHIVLNEGGNVTFSVRFSNSAGEGQTAALTQWVGPDAPQEPTQVKVEHDGNGLFTVTWTAPTACVNGGYLGQLTYDVYRIVSGDEQLVAKGISETHFTDRVEISTLQEYCYAVVASNEGTASNRVTSNKVVAGDGFGVPFVENFGADNRLEYFTVVNVAGDSDRWGELTWKLHRQVSYWGEGESYEQMICETTGTTDDWLFTPPIQMQPGNAYIVKFKMKAGYSDTPEKFEVLMGRSASISAMTTTLLPVTAITNSSYKEFSREFIVSEAGSYSIGFHAVPNSGYALYLDDLEIRLSASSGAPSFVTGLTAEAEATGLLQATLSFTAPTTTIGGASLSALSRIDILRGEQVIGSINAPAPGAQLQFTDEQAANGYNDYTIIPYNDEGNGLRAEITQVYVGVDIPAAPVVTKISDDGQHVVFAWAEAATKGARGYVVRPEDVSYRVYATDASGRRADLLYEGKDRTLQADYTDTEEIDLAKWIIVATNAAGTSTEGAAKIATGTPITLPYRETFAMGALKTTIWSEQTGLRSWNPTTTDAAGTDAGSLLFLPFATGDASSYNTPRLTFVGVKQPQLTFSYKMQAGTIVVKGWQPDGEETVFATLQPAADWTRQSYDISALKPQKYAVVKFFATGEAEVPIFIDDVLINDGAFTDGIADVSRETTTNNRYVFDLQGRRLSNDALPKGLYIKNGKKIIKN